MLDLDAARMSYFVLKFASFANTQLQQRGRWAKLAIDFEVLSLT